MGRLEQVLRPLLCHVCGDWGPVACLVSPEDPWPWPAVCPNCGRDTTWVRLIVGVAWEAF